MLGIMVNKSRCSYCFLGIVNVLIKVIVREWEFFIEWLFFVKVLFSSFICYLI